MDIIASRHAVQLAGNRGQRPIADGVRHLSLRRSFVSYSLTLSLAVHLISPTSMSDPGATYHVHEEVQHMCRTQVLIRGRQRYIEDWGLTIEQGLEANLSSFVCPL